MHCNGITVIDHVKRRLCQPTGHPLISALRLYAHDVIPWRHWNIVQCQSDSAVWEPFYTNLGWVRRCVQAIGLDHSALMGDSWERGWRKNGGERKKRVLLCTPCWKDIHLFNIPDLLYWKDLLFTSRACLGILMLAVYCLNHCELLSAAMSSSILFIRFFPSILSSFSCLKPAGRFSHFLQRIYIPSSFIQCPNDQVWILLSWCWESGYRLYRHSLEIHFFRKGYRPAKNTEILQWVV